MRVWLHMMQPKEALPSAEVAAALAGAGIHVMSPDNGPSGAGIVFFAEVTAELCALLRAATRNGRQRVIAVATSRQTLAGAAWTILDAGASDLLLWQSDETACSIYERLTRWRNIDDLVESPTVHQSLVGRSPAWITALRQIAEIAVSSEAPVLITGESGTGKEMVARVIHALGPRARRHPLVLVDCTTIVPELAGSEFFGHERGAFTGAVASRDGAFALANGSTLFLDEIGELPLALQAELLRVVQEHTYKRVGSNEWQRTDFRLVCATNRSLLDEEAHGRFRRDLFYRIAGCTCVLPPLRERREDILPLVEHFMTELRADEPPLELEEPVRTYLLAREYPGNVRELKQLLTRILLRHVGRGPITAGDIPDIERPASGTTHDWRDEGFERAVRAAVAAGVGLKSIGRAAEDLAVRMAIDAAKGSLAQAAETLQVTPRALQLRRAVTRMLDMPFGSTTSGAQPRAAAPDE
jgi:transcriptional regulator with GAF, ATPase, and Fis domain